ncbi:MAG TPA: class I SAM-dependent methyltransferase [Aestuariivirga sp.]|nr:class I SAM-dependent methyltransferase [Aestuariivirga sp.]
MTFVSLALKVPIKFAKALRQRIRRFGQFFLFSRLVSNIRKRGSIDDPGDIFNYGARGNFGLISPIQSREELVPLLSLLKGLRPRTVMEIGTANGGTLFMMTRICAPEAMILSLDLPGGPFGGGYTEDRVPLYEAFALPGQTVRLIRADSHNAESLVKVRQLLDHRTVDFLFIDGDHTYEGVRRDFEMYAPLVSPGGFIAFHDIVYAEGVQKFWAEVAPTYLSAREFVASAEPIFGIGLLQMPKSGNGSH